MGDLNFTPKQVTDPNDILDEKSNICIRSLFVGTHAIAHKIECHDKSPNTDGYIELVDEKKRPIGKITVQAKSYKAEYKGLNKASIPAYYVAYADRMRNEVCVFFSVESDKNKIYWKYISDEYIKVFKAQGDNAVHVYQFDNDEIICQENVNDVIEKWKQIFDAKIRLFSKIRKSAEVVISENYAAFHIVNTNFHNLKDSFIERKEIEQLYNWAKADLKENESNIKLLVGNAGMGKSVVAKQLMLRLKTDDIKCFAIKADRLQLSPGEQGNEQLEMLTKTFSSLIQEKRAVLIVDQIDALSQYITNDRASKRENIPSKSKS